ncbi:hypothetical protein ELI15_14110 [Rhizobium ruizarguesonis]|uniref:hypothetical protein n=1 Tax=Rhizobium ruizarguesonis TaxID=2081791 RepID=UPI0010309240|nr:hypothetical protein [Rhizobium ruizarguesonis]TAW65424.1 hypothetical protein ELI15_14110 [Rhizobium ruizarguesonis]
MKLVTKKELHALPAGTIYSNHTEHRGWHNELVSDLLVKGESLPNNVNCGFDFLISPLLPVEDTDGVVEHLWHTSREGTFDDTMLFWVWEAEDRHRLVQAILDPGNRHLVAGPTAINSDSFDIHLDHLTGDMVVRPKSAGGLQI